jgi:hypothetical protein
MRKIILLLLLSMFAASASAEIKTIDITIFGMD